MENKHHNKKKQGKNLLKQKTNNKQIEEEKVIESEQEIVQPKIFNLSKNTLSRYIKLILYYVAENSLLHQYAISYN